ncbi:MAG: hypothetical protein O2973_03565 [Gemmatimonadetes bacterium]|nr:hypothetical protein [Gemmatimonadota bacterium]
MHTFRHGSSARWMRIGAIALIALVLSVAVYGNAEAHDQGTLKLVSKTFRAGDSLVVLGTKFTPDDEVTLLLLGVSGRITLAKVPTDTAGGFRRVLLVPASVAPGQYRLLAEAIDGDVVAGLDVMVTAAAAPMAPMAGVANMEGMPGHEGMATDPTGEALSIDRERSTAVTATAILLIIACAAAGAMFLRGSHANPLEEQS